MTAEHLDLPQGTLDRLILRTLALGPQHGWAISERVGSLGNFRKQTPRKILRPFKERP
jgi:hypothetical protein